MLPSNRALSESSEVSVNSLTFNLTKAQEHFDEHKFADLGGTCTFYSEIGSSGCYKPRSCSDCLVRSECMINEFGVCVNREFGGYNESMDFRLAQKQGLVMPPTEPSIVNTAQSWHFLESAVDYCWEADPVCKQCREANF
ncbi:hypothetical protein Poli38472_009388 [Pythium oligandrum]|uniref:Uncharacterized protein n=1 Tax=Pythium oligandrum TaxID=41045 RepID=A0A8K1FJR8_PYTOL|nr:hypothetical protein Poli38472_009388 [Pythium oligandrum]|eukprot:TMW65221.1 hypothetical protein Poli38472_009388 [Pythium oligandrum]